MDEMKKSQAADAENPVSKNDDASAAKKNSEEAKPSEEHKSFKEKIKDALQDWSNDNERDIEADDSDPLRSGL